MRAHFTRVEHCQVWSCDNSLAKTSIFGVLEFCYFDLLSKEEVGGLEGALEAAAAIEDSVIKSAGVLEWIAQNNRKVSPEEGQRLCDVLVNWEKTQCERRLYAAHLQR